MEKCYYIRLTNDFEESLKLFKQFIHWGKMQGYNINPDWRILSIEMYVRQSVLAYGAQKICYFDPKMKELNGWISDYFFSQCSRRYELVLWSPYNIYQNNVSIF